MSVVSVAEVPWESDAEGEATGERKAKRLFKVNLDHGDRAYIALLGNGVPRIHDAYPDDPLMLAVSAKSRFESGSSTLCHVTVNYSNRLPNPEENDQDDPLNSRPKEEWGAEEFDEIVEKDRDDKVPLNTAGDAFDEPITFTHTRPVLTVKRNESSFDSLTAYQYNNSTNEDVFRGAEPGTLRVQVTGSPQYINSAEYYEVTYRFRYNPRGWQPKPLSQGLYQLVPSETPGEPDIKVPCTEKGVEPFDSPPATIPMPLDENGRQIPVANLPDDAYYIDNIEVLEPLPYLSLGL